MKRHDIENLARHLFDKALDRGSWAEARDSVKAFYRKLARAALEYLANSGTKT